MKALLSLLVTVTAMLASSLINNSATANDLIDYFHFRPTEADDPAGLAVILPGSSGLKIFKDETHYFDAAANLNAKGFDVVLVDYKSAYIAGGRPDVGETGHKIAWAADRAMAWVREAHGLRGEHTLLMAWSLGAEGAWVLTNRPGAKEQFDGAILYYPSNQDGLKLAPQTPTLVFVGSEDTVTPATDLAGPPLTNSNLELVVLEGAFHGFDIDSLNKPRVFRFPPVIGRKFIFQHHPTADRDAEQLLAEFLLRLKR